MILMVGCAGGLDAYVPSCTPPASSGCSVVRATRRIESILVESMSLTCGASSAARRVIRDDVKRPEAGTGQFRAQSLFCASKVRYMF